MNLNLLNEVTKEEKGEAEAQFRASPLFRRAVVAYCKRKIEVIHVSMRDPERYKESAWAMHQADFLGEIRAYEKIISLFS